MCFAYIQLRMHLTMKSYLVAAPSHVERFCAHDLPENAAKMTNLRNMWNLFNTAVLRVAICGCLRVALILEVPSFYNVIAAAGFFFLKAHLKFY
jgi:hypothetical protein